MAAARHEACYFENRVQWRSQLVRDHRHELVLQPGGPHPPAGQHARLKEPFAHPSPHLALRFIPPAFRDVAKDEHDTDSVAVAGLMGAALSSIGRPVRASAGTSRVWLEGPTGPPVQIICLTMGSRRS